MNADEYIKTFDAAEFWRSVYMDKPGCVIRSDESYYDAIRRINLDNALRQAGYCEPVPMVKAI